MDLAAHWRELEELFASSGYQRYSSTPVAVVPGVPHPRVVISAPHALNHVRNGQTKPADRGTGGLALLLGAHLGVSVVLAGQSDNGDANHDREHPLKDAIAALDPLLVVDLHGMRERPGHPFEADLGLGPTGLVPERFVMTLSGLLTTNENGLFASANTTRVTAWSQVRRIPAVQVELAASMRPPLGNDRNVAWAAKAFLEALRAELDAR